MGDLNLNVNVSTSTYVPVDAQVPPVATAPLPPQVTLGPLDTTDTAESGIAPPIAYSAAAETPQLLQTVTSDLQTVTNSGLSALADMEAGSFSVDENGYALNPDTVTSLMGNTLQSSLDSVNAQIAVLQQLPDDFPGKMDMLSFLQSVSSAITELKELLAEMQAFDPKSAHARMQNSLDQAKESLNSASSLLTGMSLDDLIEQSGLSPWEAQRLEKAINLMQSGNAANLLWAMDIITDILGDNPNLLTENSAFVTALVTSCIVDAALEYGGYNYGVLNSLQEMLDTVLNTASNDPSVDPSARDATILALKMTMTAAIIMAVVNSAFLSENLLNSPWKLNGLIEGSQIGNALFGLNGMNAETMNAGLFTAAAAPFLMALLINETLQKGNFDLAFSAISDNLGVVLLALMSGTQNIFGVTVDPAQADAALLGMKMAMTTAIMLAIVMSASDSNGLLDCSQGFEGMLQACQVGFAAISLAGLDETAQNYGNLAVTCAVMAVILASCMNADGLVVGEDLLAVLTQLSTNATALAELLGTQGSELLAAFGTALAAILSETGNEPESNDLTDIFARLTLLGADDADMEAKNALVKLLKEIIKKLQETIGGAQNFVAGLNTGTANTLTPEFSS